MFSSLESQGLAQRHPVGPVDHQPRRHQLGTDGQRLRYRRAPRTRSTSRRSLADGSIVAEEYYNQNNSGFGGLLQAPADARRTATRRSAPADAATTAQPAAAPRPARQRHGRKLYRLPFSPFGIESLTRFARNGEGPADYPSAATIRTTRPPSASSRTRRPRPTITCSPSARPARRIIRTASSRRRSTAASTSSRTASRSTSRRRCC